MKLKQRYNRICYVCRWKYPQLYALLRKGKFPGQLALVLLTMMMAVNFYQKHFSFEASMRSANRAALNAPQETVPADALPSNSLSAQRLQTEVNPASFKASDSTSLEKYQTPDTNPVSSVSVQTVGKIADERTAIVTKVINTAPVVATRATSIDRTNTLTDPIEKVLKSEDDLLVEVMKAEDLLRRKKQQTIKLEERVKRARTLLSTSDRNDKPASTSTKHTLKTTEWLTQQPERHFIVQIASSTDHILLTDFASNTPLDAPVAIYPFKVNKVGDVVYGLSSGLYIAWDDAMADVPTLSEVAKKHGVWVRRVSEIKKQLASLEQLQIVR